MQEWRKLFYEVLEHRLTELKSKNARFSMRAFAKMAKVSPGRMSGLLKRQEDWNLSPERAVEILANIKVSVRDRNKILLSSRRKLDMALHEVPIDNSSLLQDSSYIPILLSFDMTVVPSIQSMAERLNMSPKKVQQVVEDLLAQGYLLRDSSDKIFKIDKNIALTDPREREAIRRNQANDFGLMQEFLYQIPRARRDISSMTLVGGKEELERVRDEIKEFYSRVFTILDGAEKKDEIFKICVGISPVDFSYKKKNSV